MSLINPQQIDKSGLNPVLTSAAGGGDAFACSGKEVVYVENTDSAQHTVTIPAQKANYNDAVYGKQDLDDITVTIPSGEFRLIAGVTPAAFAKDNGEAVINYDAATGIKIAILRHG